MIVKIPHLGLKNGKGEDFKWSFNNRANLTEKTPIKIINKRLYFMPYTDDIENNVICEITLNRKISEISSE